MKLSRKNMMVMAAIVVVIILIVTVVVPMMNKSSDSAAPAAPSPSDSDDSETPAAPAVPVVDLSGSFERQDDPGSPMNPMFHNMPSTIILDKDGKLKSYESKNIHTIMAVQNDDGSITVNSDPNVGVRYTGVLRRVNNTLSGKVAGYGLNYVM